MLAVASLPGCQQVSASERYNSMKVEEFKGRSVEFFEAHWVEFSHAVADTTISEVRNGFKISVKVEDGVVVISKDLAGNAGSPNEMNQLGHFIVSHPDNVEWEWKSKMCFLEGVGHEPREEQSEERSFDEAVALLKEVL